MESRMVQGMYVERENSSDGSIVFRVGQKPHIAVAIWRNGKWVSAKKISVNWQMAEAIAQAFGLTK